MASPIPRLEPVTMALVLCQSWDMIAIERFGLHFAFKRSGGSGGCHVESLLRFCLCCLQIGSSRFGGLDADTSYT